MKRQQGVSLIELMIAVAIVAILGAIAYPSYTSHVSQSRRAEAKAELIELALLQEQYYMDNSQYATTFKLLGLGDVTSLNTENGYYKVELDSVSVANGTFTVKATALGGQASSDADCSWFTINQNGDKSAETNYCW